MKCKWLFYQLLFVKDKFFRLLELSFNQVYEAKNYLFVASLNAVSINNIYKVFSMIVEGETFGPTADYHQDFMSTIWGPAANVAVILALYSYRKIWAWVHGSFFFLATIFSLSTAIPILSFAGIIPADSPVSYEYPASTIYLHQIIGISCLSAITLSTLLGIATKLINILNGKSSLILLFRKIHRIDGYFILTLCIVNLYIISFS